MGPVRFALGVRAAQRLAARGSEPLRLFARQGVEIDQRHLPFDGEPAHRFRVGHQRIRLELALGVEVAAHDGGHQDGSGAGRADLFDEALHVGAVGGGRIGLALRAFPRHVVVPELDQHEVRFLRQHLGPRAFVAEALRAAPVARQVDHLDLGPERSAESGAPAPFVVDGGISHQDDLNRLAGAGRQGKREGREGENVTKHGSLVIIECREGREQAAPRRRQVKLPRPFALRRTAFMGRWRKLR